MLLSRSSVADQEDIWTEFRRRRTASRVPGAGQKPLGSDSDQNTRERRYGIAISKPPLMPADCSRPAAKLNS